MNDREKHPHPDHHDEHEHEHDHKKKKKKEKRGRRHGGLVLFLLLALIILIALVWFFRNGFGLGAGSGDGQSGTNPSDTSSVSADNSSAQNSDITQIRIEKNDIYIGSELCADENVLKERVIAAGSGKKYELVHGSAIKETYDKVKQVMLELKDALDLNVNFNE